MEENTGDVPDWSNLGSVLFTEIAGRLPSAEDYMAFRCVCRSWRAAADAGKSGFGAKTRTVPMLMLAENGNNGERELYSITKKKIYRALSLPEANLKRCIEARFGWLVIITKSGDISLFNPFSRANIKLPRKRKGHCDFIRAAMLSANPSYDSSGFVLMVIFHKSLRFWRPGNTKWTRVGQSLFSFKMKAVGYCKEKFYVIDRGGNVNVLNEDQSMMRVITKIPMSYSKKKLYLVESSDGELIVISRSTWVRGGLGYGDAKPFRLIQIDVMKGEWQEISGLDKDAVFIGTNTPFCVPVSQHTDAIKPNCIYFSDDTRKFHFALGMSGGFGRDMGIYNIHDGSIERFRVESLSPLCPPLWVDSSNIFNDYI